MTELKTIILSDDENALLVQLIENQLQTIGTQITNLNEVKAYLQKIQSKLVTSDEDS